MPGILRIQTARIRTALIRSFSRQPDRFPAAVRLAVCARALDIRTTIALRRSALALSALALSALALFVGTQSAETQCVGTQFVGTQCGGMPCESSGTAMTGTAMTLCCQTPFSLVARQVHPQDDEGELASQVQQLVDRLDDPSSSLAQRRAAERDLVELGPRILGLLPEVFSPSAKQALQRVRLDLEKAAGKLALQGTRVTLKSGTPVAIAIEQLSTSTGNDWGDIPDTQATVTNDFQDTLYWRVLDGVLDDADWEIGRFPLGRKHLPLIPRGDQVVPRLNHALYHESFRIDLQRIETVRDLKSPSRSRLTIRIRVAWEPRLHPVKLTLPTREWILRDQQGNPFSLKAQTDELTVPVTAHIPYVEFDLRFELPDGGADSIDQLVGSITGLIPANPQSITFAGLERLERQSERVAEAVITLENTLADRKGNEFVVSVRFDDASDALESHHRWAIENVLVAQTAEGESHQAVETKIESETRDGVTVRFRFPPEVPLEGTRLRYTTPTAIVPYEIPVKFHPIELP